MNFQLYMWDIKIKVFLSCLEECLSRTLILFGQAENQNTVTLKKLLYNLAFIHRAYITTYNTPRGARVPELFIPVKTAQAPVLLQGK